MKTINIEKHLDRIQLKMCEIPDIIDTRNDKVLWDVMFTCNFLLLELVDIDFISENSMNILVADYLGYMVIINDMVQDKSKYFLVNVYFIIMLEYMIDYCEGYELFEACANLKNFSEKI
jgi:hypothetical protein